MNNTTFLPKKIRVGYQERQGTYTGKLAYVIYYDNKGKIRKEPSWNSWRDKEIEPNEYENEPLEGFVLNKKVGGYRSNWNHRQSMIRVYDPRGFEFEITPENLLYILENTSSIVGKGLEGEFVYGYNGADLILIPTSAPDYQDMLKLNEKLHSNETVKTKDLVVNKIYVDRKNREYLYMGRYPKWKFDYSTRPNRNGYLSHHHYYHGNKQFGKGANEHWFCALPTKSPEDYNDYGYNFESFKGISGKFFEVKDSEEYDYATIHEQMLTHYELSPWTYDTLEIEEMSFEEFEKIIIRRANEWHWGNAHYFYIKDTTSAKLPESRKVSIIGKVNDPEDPLKLRVYSLNEMYSYSSTGTIFEDFKEAYDDLKPVKINIYLENGKFHKTIE